MIYTIDAKETRYGGCLFRSRLEARWAAFFDIVGWRWTYEPCDFSGWSPDFLLHGATPVYVEVKPILAFDVEVEKKMESSGCDGELLLLGMSPNLEDMLALAGSDRDGVYYTHLGWVPEDRPDLGIRRWGPAIIARFERETCPLYRGPRTLTRPGFCGFLGTDKTDRISGLPAINWPADKAISPEEINEMWCQAHEPTRFTY